jgi:uncharacterized coiled-coil protein SlyX
MLEKLFEVILSEYGGFFCFMIVTIAGLVVALKQLWKVNVKLDARLDALSNKFLLALENNTKVITQLVERLGSHHDDKK